MELRDKIKICMTCQQCKRDHRGVVCGITDEKPTFDFQCPDYIANEDAVAQLKAQDNERQVDEDPKLPGAHWFRTIAILSLLNVGLAFVGIAFIYGLGSTQILQTLSEIGLINKVLAYTIIVLIPLYFLWTWWIAAYKAYIYPYIVGLCVYALDTILCAILLFNVGVSGSLIVTLIFQLFVIVSLSVSLFKNESRQIREKFSWGVHKILYTIASALVVITMVVSMYYVFNLPSTNDDIEEFVEKSNMWLPQETEEGITLYKIYVQNDDVVLEYRCDEGYYNAYALQNVSDEDMDIIMSYMTPDTNEYYIASQGYDVVYKYATSQGEFIVEWHFSSDDILEMN
jgi:hypothetical protein